MPRFVPITLEGVIARSSAKFEPEIERRFLVERIPLGTHDHPETRSECNRSEITQYYLKNGEIEYGKFRLRSIDGMFEASIKRGKGLVREEKKWNITKLEFHALLRRGEWHGLKKTRYFLDSYDEEIRRNVTIELDVFRALRSNGGVDLRGLVIAEAEFKNLDHARNFEPLDWMGEEITHKKGHGNRSFATKGIPEGIKLFRRV